MYVVCGWKARGECQIDCITTTAATTTTTPIIIIIIIIIRRRRRVITTKNLKGVCIIKN
jgi:hypothetical protein